MNPAARPLPPSDAPRRDPSSEPPDDPAVATSIAHGDLERAQADRFPTSMSSVLAVDHLRIAGLIDEVSRPSDTQGVFEDVAGQLARAVDRHLACIEQVLEPEVVDFLDRSDADLARASHRLLTRMLDIVRASSPSARPNIEHLRLAFDRHVEAEQGVIERLAAHRGAQRLATMGAEFSALNDGAPTTASSTASSSGPPAPISPPRTNP